MSTDAFVDEWEARGLGKSSIFPLFDVNVPMPADTPVPAAEQAGGQVAGDADTDAFLEDWKARGLGKSSIFPLFDVNVPMPAGTAAPAAGPARGQGAGDASASHSPRAMRAS
jgi:hypothetical protein